MVWRWPNDLYWWFEIQALCCGDGFTFFYAKVTNFEIVHNQCQGDAQTYDVLKTHIKSDILKDLISNGIFDRTSKSKKRTVGNCKSLNHQKRRTASYYQRESDFCFTASNLLLEKYKERIETKFSGSYHQMGISIHSKNSLGQWILNIFLKSLKDLLRQDWNGYQNLRLKVVV